MTVSDPGSAAPVAGGARRVNRAEDDFVGSLLIDQQTITAAQLEQARSAQQGWQVPLGDALVALGFVRAADYYPAVAAYFGAPYLNLIDEPPDEALLESASAAEYGRELLLPWRRVDGRLWVVAADPGPELVLRVRRRYPDVHRIAVTSKFDILWTLQRVFAHVYTGRSLSALAIADPDVSARTVFTLSQLVVLYVLAVAVIGGLAVAPVATLVTINVFMTAYFLGNFLLKTLLAWEGGGRGMDAANVSSEQVSTLSDATLPVYTVLVPAFREPAVLPIITGALRRMDYPLAKLDIKLVLEEDDHETIDAAKALALESIFEIIRVPRSQPRTKPKACNYALHFARGEYTVIYDAEDKPEADQLKKAIIAFRNASPNTACIQARLNYFNAEENWLTRMFTIDYSLWFDLMLTGLEVLRIPIPLGGTSNHFRTSVLRELHAWDPYNVTEDADLGVRLTQKGYRVGTVNSTTFEEAVVSVPAWIRQRSRWMKGYMQTYLVHMRNPLALHRSLGAVGFWGFQFFVGGTVAAGLFNPVFWLMFLVWLVSRSHAFDIAFPDVLLYLSLFNLLVGNVLFTYLALIAPVKRGRWRLAPFAFSVFFYWVLLSIAAYKGLWQLLTRPFYWEKTQHGMSNVTIDDATAQAV